MIDWSHVEELKDDMADGFDEVVTVFLEEVEEGVAKLGTCASPDSLAAGLHFLKGAALNLGFTQFAALCSDGELQAEKGQIEAIDLAAVATCYKTSLQEFQAGLQQRAA
ncbi:Hpt domain-containing protein [Pararhodobacter sp.]|uniref:Hpt domain-containing protein n=1 Tax=Pararhodobacter sp. TaxID=2127056 RepID=UPI002AFFFF91|nr:Hpt domain-containing protein [Pararhodobacter sp.]